MFNKKTYRILKKKFFLQKKHKYFSFKNMNNLLLKNKTHSTLQFLLFFKLKLSKNNSRNVCSVTGKYKSIFNSLKISRHTIRRFGDISQLPNYSKFSWKCLKL